MRVGIVNDLEVAREALRRVVQSDPGHRVAWVAGGGAEAVAAALRDRPDVILMDLIMPGMDGVETTRRVMAEAPCPVLVVTSSVSDQFGKVYEAMGNGAIDAVDTPTLGPDGDLRGGDLLLAKMATVAKLTGKAPCREAAPAGGAAAPARPRPGATLVAIGASTGGPNALAEVLSALPRAWAAAVVIIQHVDAAFAPGLAQWLSDRTGHRVEVAAGGARPEPGRFLLAGTDDHLVVRPGGLLRYVQEPRDYCYRPSADVFFASAAEHWPTAGVAVLLTGMGRDGAAGMLALRRAGWRTVAQDEASSVVWGMPRAAVEAGAAERVLSLGEIGPAVVERVRGEG